jgi:hypothetical protein
VVLGQWRDVADKVLIAFGARKSRAPRDRGSPGLAEVGEEAADKGARGSATESRGSGDERLSRTGPHNSETKFLVKRA